MNFTKTELITLSEALQKIPHVGGLLTRVEHEIEIVNVQECRQAEEERYAKTKDGKRERAKELRLPLRLLSKFDRLMDGTSPKCCRSLDYFVDWFRGLNSGDGEELAVALWLKLQTYPMNRAVDILVHEWVELPEQDVFEDILGNGLALAFNISRKKADAMVKVYYEG